ncbi:hypothetical protein ACWDYJ_33990 [Streptomyces sp. NPDC003042]
MNDSPGWATPGPPSDGQGSDSSRPPAQPSGDSKWSAAQPPPGQWSSPAAGQTPPPQQQGAGWGPYGPQSGHQPGQQPGPPYGAPYGGQYGYPGTPGGWGGPPPAAKPGVIPLRPLGLGEILDGAVSTMRGHWRSVLSISLVVASLIQLGILLLQRLTMDSLVVPAEDPASPSEAIAAMGDAMLIYATDYYLQLLGLLLVTALLAPVVSRAVLGQSSTVSTTLRAVRPLAPRMLGLTVLLFLGSLAAGILPALPGILADSAGLVAIGVPVGIVLLAWFYVTFALAPPALMLERGSVTDALKRSAKLVRGAWWRVFGISLLTWAIRWVTTMVIVVPFAVVAVYFSPGGFDSLFNGSAGLSWTFLIIAAIGSVVGLTVTMPMQTGVTALLYIDQRIRREALDLDLARAAGLEHDGPSAPQPGGDGPVTGG